MTGPSPAKQWLVTVEKIHAYADSIGAEVSEEVIRQALRSRELEGRRRSEGGKWFCKPEWVEAWIDSFGQVAS